MGINRALITVDLQKYFSEQYPGKIDIDFIDRINDEIKEFRKNRSLIIHLRTLYKKDKTNWPKYFKDKSYIWCIEDSEESEFIPQIDIQENDIIVTKTRFSGFFNTDLLEILKKNSVDIVFICGFAIDGCVGLTIMDAYNYDYEIEVKRDCVNSAFLDSNLSLDYISKLSKCKII